MSFQHDTSRRCPRIKICGVTCPEQGLKIALLGADAIGLIVGAESPRKIGLRQASAIIQKLPPFVTKIALVANQSKERINQIISQLSVDYVQFHGDESDEFCQQFTFPYIRCLRVRDNEVNLIAQMQNILDQGAKAVLLDAWDSKKYGGTGKQIVIDYQSLRYFQHPFILAGGITADNVVQKIKDFQPYAIDVSSGVEISPGNKDMGKVYSLIYNIVNYQRSLLN